MTARVLLPVPLTITPDFKPALLNPELEVKLQASWLVCKHECVPQDGEFVLRLPVQGSTAINGAAFDAAFKAAAQGAHRAPAASTVQDHALNVSVAGLPASLQGKTLDFFPETPEVIETARQLDTKLARRGLDGSGAASRRSAAPAPR